MNESQKQFGSPPDRVVGKVRPEMHPWIQSFISNSCFLVMATSDSNGNCDASPKGGMQGFVKVLDNRRLLIPDVAGNRLFQSYENIESNPHIGLIFFIPGVITSVRVNGAVKVIGKGNEVFDTLQLEVSNADDNAKLLQAPRGSP